MNLIGLCRLGRDAELRFTTGGDPVLSISAAYDYGQKDPATGERPTQWVNASLWGKRGETLAPFLKRGKSVHLVLSDVHIRIFKRQDGTRGEIIEGKVLDIHLAGNARDGSTDATPSQAAAPSQAQAPAAPRPAPQPAMAGAEMDDIPFAPLDWRLA